MSLFESFADELVKVAYSTGGSYVTTGSDGVERLDLYEATTHYAGREKDPVRSFWGTPYIPKQLRKHIKAKITAEDPSRPTYSASFSIPLAEAKKHKSLAPLIQQADRMDMRDFGKLSKTAGAPNLHSIAVDIVKVAGASQKLVNEVSENRGVRGLLRRILGRGEPRPLAQKNMVLRAGEGDLRGYPTKTGPWQRTKSKAAKNTKSPAEPLSNAKSPAEAPRVHVPMGFGPSGSTISFTFADAPSTAKTYARPRVTGNRFTDARPELLVQRKRIAIPGKTPEKTPEKTQDAFDAYELADRLALLLGR